MTTLASTLRAAASAALATVLLTGGTVSARQAADGSGLRTYTLLETSLLDVETERGGLFGFMGHDHLVRARSFEGLIEYDPGSPEVSAVNITVLTEGLEVLTPAGSDDLAEIDASMREALRQEEHPRILIASRRVVPRDDGVRLTADVTLVGVTREVTLDVDLALEGDTLRAHGSFEVDQRDFGIEPFSKVGGAVKVKDEITFRFDVQAVAAGS